MTFGNGIVAIVAGIISSAVSVCNAYEYFCHGPSPPPPQRSSPLYLLYVQLASSFSFVAPFDGSMALLIVGTIYVALKWSENYGDKMGTGFSNFRDAWSVLVSSM